MKNFSKLSLLLLFLTFGIMNAQSRFYNIILVADLSDRNLADKEHLPKFPMDYDLKVISEIMKEFKRNVKRNFYITSNDKITFVSLPLNENIDIIEEHRLKIDMTQISIRVRRFQLDNLIADFLTKVSQVYKRAIRKKTVGADIWDFFKNDLPNYLIEDNLYENIVVLLTDGYLYFDESYKNRRISTSQGATFMEVAKARYSNGKVKLLPTGKRYDNVNILMMGVDPIVKYSQREIMLLKDCWTQWFNSMNVKRFEIVRLNNARVSIELSVTNFFGRLRKEQ